MGSRYPLLTEAGFARLQEQVSTATARCSEAQMLSLADHIHDAIRARRKDRRRRPSQEQVYWV